MSPCLQNKICLVTGASKGIGRGIALQLGQAGATVYITGRTKSKLEECASEIGARGGRGVPLVVDHANDKEVADLFDKIRAEHRGRLDVLVNNAYAGVDAIFSNSRKKFYELDPAEQWDTINGVGLRGHYLCTTYGSRMMVDNKSGLIVNVSSIGGLKYLFNVAYGIGKAGCDRMATDCAQQLKKSNVAMVSLWPGPVLTEYLEDQTAKSGVSNPGWTDAESLEYAGMAVAHLAADKSVMSKTGRILLTPDVAREYGYVDLDGGVHDYRSLKSSLLRNGNTWMAAWVPGFLRIPLFVMHYAGYKF